jgi:hypothetical protein
MRFFPALLTFVVGSGLIAFGNDDALLRSVGVLAVLASLWLARRAQMSGLGETATIRSPIVPLLIGGLLAVAMLALAGVFLNRSSDSNGLDAHLLLVALGALGALVAGLISYISRRRS